MPSQSSGRTIECSSASSTSENSTARSTTPGSRPPMCAGEPDAYCLLSWASVHVAHCPRFSRIATRCAATYSAARDSVAAVRG